MARWSEKYKNGSPRARVDFTPMLAELHSEVMHLIEADVGGAFDQITADENKELRHAVSSFVGKLARMANDGFSVADEQSHYGNQLSEHVIHLIEAVIKQVDEIYHQHHSLSSAEERALNIEERALKKDLRFFALHVEKALKDERARQMSPQDTQGAPSPTRVR